MRVKTQRPGRRRDRDEEHGVVAIIVALSMVMLLVVAAMVLDFGVVRVDRQRAKATADSAAMAGMRAADGKTGDVYSFRAVCSALSFLRVNDERMAGLPDGICASPDNTIKCSSAAPAAHPAVYDDSITTGGTTYRVVIKSPYSLGDGGFVEEGYSSLTADPSLESGCDQVGVVISESRKPGLGSLATSGDLSFSVRSVGRATLGGSDDLAPALILLERTACSVLTVGSAGAGAGSFIKVLGYGKTPGSIHVDSAATGSDCGSGSNKQLLQGKQADGIIAYGSTTPTGTAGIITSVATNDGKAANVAADALANVYGTTATSGTGVTKAAVTGRAAVGRGPVDTRYRLGVRDEIATAQAAGVWTMTAAGATSAGWTVTDCSPTGAQLNVTTKLYINCPGNSGITLNNKTISAGEILFNGFVKGGSVSMPNASRVYVNNTDSSGNPVNAAAVSLSNNDGFCVRGTCATTSGAKCSLAQSANRAVLLVRQGDLDASGGLLRLCNTTAILLGGYPASGCVPTSDGALPTDMPCAATGSNKGGNTRIDVTGGAQLDWTAPNKSATYISDKATRESAWRNDLEDLALWSESFGLYRMAGSGSLSVSGVFMAPNAMPFTVGGGGSQTLTNAQYIARTFSVTGGGTLSLTVDPRNAVTIPSITGFLLVR